MAADKAAKLPNIGLTVRDHPVIKKTRDNGVTYKVVVYLFLEVNEYDE